MLPILGKVEFALLLVALLALASIEVSASASALKLTQRTLAQSLDGMLTGPR
jgi:hypothetical protein